MREEVLRSIKRAALSSLEWMREEGGPIPEPIGMKKYKGQISLRVPPEVHKALVLESKEENRSVNQFLLTRLTYQT